MLLDDATDVLATVRLTRLLMKDSFPPAERLRAYIAERFPATGQVLKSPPWQPVDTARHPRTLRRWVGVLGVFHPVEVEAGVNVMSAGSVVSKGHPLGDLFDCPWCLSMWVGLGVFAARRVAPGPWGWVARALAASLTAGLAAERFGV